MILEKLGVFGWKEQDENLVLASLLTGDPLLLIGSHGSAKTLIATKIAEALDVASLVYDASKAMFEDVLGYPNVEKLKHGQVEYIPSPVTIWDKELVVIDELNRATLELQSKWLEIIRSRKIMGFETKVKWVWAAMNPMSYAGTQSLDEALIGRFAIFLYPPDVLQMSEEDRIRVTTHINGDDAPSLDKWLPEGDGKTVLKETVQQTGAGVSKVLHGAAKHFVRLKEEMSTLPEFLAKFADLLMRETKGGITLDGRRLGFIYRNLLANRAVELAKSEACEASVPSFEESARYALQASIPVGLNDEAVQMEESVHKMDVCFSLLAQYFEQGSEIETVNRIYELFTTGDPIRKAEILLTESLGDLAHTKAWNDLINGDENITLLAYTALQVEARRPGTIPQELLESLSHRITPGRLSTAVVPHLQGESVEYVDEIEALLDQETDLGKLIAINWVRPLAQNPAIRPEEIEATRSKIVRDIEVFERLTSGTANAA